MRNNKLLGTGVALITPFHDDYTIDYKSLERLIEHLIENGINYLVVMGTTAESATLDYDEQNHILNFVKKIVNNRLPIVFGLGSNNTNQLVDRIRNIDFEGVEAILSVTPYYNKPSQRGMFNHYDIIANNTPVDIIIYNVPSRTASHIDPKTVEALAIKHNNIIGIKEASGDINNCMELVSRCPDDFMIISGDDKMTFPIMSLGGVGVISVQAMAFPNLFSEMVNACLNEKYNIARKKHYKLLESVDLFYIDGNPSGIKEALYFKKICNSNQVRPPLVKMELENMKKIHSLL